MFAVLTFWLSLEFDDTYRKQVPKQFSAKTCKEFVNIESSLLLLDIFDILTEALNSINSIALYQRGQMSKKVNSLNNQR